MEFAQKTGEIASDIERRDEGREPFHPKALDKFDRLLGDDKLERAYSPEAGMPQADPLERENKFHALFENGDFFAPLEQCKEEDGNSFEDDDSDWDGEGNEYTVNGNIYRTDQYDRILSCDAEPKLTKEGVRNIREQREAGGEERQELDDGGHIVAKILGGSEGAENLVPMRRTLNRGDYKKMENEIAGALADGKEVPLRIDLQYEGDSKRPSELQAEYEVDGKKRIVEFDNRESSTELLESLERKIGREDYSNLKMEIEDMREDGAEVTITSVKTQYDENSIPAKITVGILEESTGRKTYKVYEPGQEA